MTLSQLPALSVRVMEIQTCADPAFFRIQGASVLNFQSNGNSTKRRRDHWYSEENQGHRSRRLPPCVSRRSEEARQWEERQKSRVEGLRSRSLLRRSSPQSVRRFLWPCEGAVVCLPKRRQLHGWTCPLFHGNAVFFFCFEQLDVVSLPVVETQKSRRNVIGVDRRETGFFVAGKERRHCLGSWSL